MNTTIPPPSEVVRIPLLLQIERTIHMVKKDNGCKPNVCIENDEHGNVMLSLFIQDSSDTVGLLLQTTKPRKITQALKTLEKIFGCQFVDKDGYWQHVSIDQKPDRYNLSSEQNQYFEVNDVELSNDGNVRHIDHSGEIDAVHPMQPGLFISRID